MEQVQVTGVLALICLVLAVAAGMRPAAAAADPVLGLADDGGLVTQPLDPDGVLLAGLEHGARFVRVMALMSRYPDEARYLEVAHAAAARGLGLDVVLALPWADAQDGVGPQDFAAWAARLAGRLAQAGAPLRLSVLNEPDLILPAGDDCDPVTADQVVREAGYVPMVKRVRVVIRRSRIVRRVTRRHGVRRVIRRRLVWKVHRFRTVRRLALIQLAHTTSTITVARGCLSIQRARRAAGFLDAAIPAVRAAAPGAEVGAGETSPGPGVEVFMRELARIGIPPLDRWAHHPYPVVADGRQVASPPGASGADRLADYARLARALFGDALPVDVTEFGVRHDRVPDPEVRAAIWRATFAQACEGGVRSIVAYQWTPTPTGQGRTWDTSILGAQYAATPESRQLPALRC